jgi:microcystin-dependent protein
MKPFSLDALLEQAGNHHSVIAYFDADSWALLDHLLTFAHTKWMWDGDKDTIDELFGRTNYNLGVSAMLGSIVHVAGTPPAGFLICDGTQYDQADYPALFDVLDSVYKTGSTFVVPDLVHFFIQGADTGEINDTGGEEEHTLTVDEMPAHSHSNTPHSHLYTPPVLNLDLESPGVPDILGAGIGIPTQTGTSGVTIDNTGGDEPFPTLPPYVRLIPCIVAF